MVRAISYSNTEVRFSDAGKGTCIVLLHGYLESLEIWNCIAEELHEDFRVICPDLPGHGKSGILGDVHTMEKLAESVIAVLDHCLINKCFIIGHSMGGYTGLALMENYPERLNGLCLFHSHPFPDTKQTMNNRCREIVLVNQGKKELISRINIPKAFTGENLEHLRTEVERATQIALSTPDEGIIACLNGMMQRPSRENILSETTLPVLLIAGKHDNYIDFENVAKQVKLPAKGNLTVFENSGHIGFIEERDKALSSIRDFVTDNM